MCCVVRYGMVWYGVVWYGSVWYGIVWGGMVWYSDSLCVMVWYRVKWYCVVWCSVVWCGMCGRVCCGVMWYGMLCKQSHYVTGVSWTTTMQPSFSGRQKQRNNTVNVLFSVFFECLKNHAMLFSRNKKHCCAFVFSKTLSSTSKDGLEISLSEIPISRNLDDISRNFVMVFRVS